MVLPVTGQRVWPPGQTQWKCALDEAHQQEGWLADNEGMPNIATVLKAEVTRLARKELRGETEALRKTVVRSAWTSPLSNAEFKTSRRR